MIKNKKVLIVDDDKLVRLVIEKVAQRHGATVTGARDGKEALRALREAGRYDVVFLDLLIPHVSGWDILDSIRANKNTVSTPVVILSGAPVSQKEKDKLSDDDTVFMDKGKFSLARFEPMMDELLARQTGSHERETNRPRQHEYVQASG